VCARIAGLIAALAASVGTRHSSVAPLRGANAYDCGLWGPHRRGKTFAPNLTVVCRRRNVIVAMLWSPSAFRSAPEFHLRRLMGDAALAACRVLDLRLRHLGWVITLGGKDERWRSRLYGLANATGNALGRRRLEARVGCFNPQDTSFTQNAYGIGSPP
jgi:hypothetical protein